jgi:hypothetical protein
MKKTIISAVVFASMFVVGAVPNAQARQCSNASLEGAYGFLDGHTLVPAGTPFAGLGRWNFDGKGNFTNTLTIKRQRHGDTRKRLWALYRECRLHWQDFHTRRHGNHRDRARGRR